MENLFHWFFREFAYQSVWFYVISAVSTFGVFVFFAYQEKKDSKSDNEGEGPLALAMFFLWYLAAVLILVVAIYLSIQKLAELTAGALVSKPKPPNDVEKIKEKMGYDNLPKMG